MSHKDPDLMKRIIDKGDVAVQEALLAHAPRVITWSVMNRHTTVINSIRRMSDEMGRSLFGVNSCLHLLDRSHGFGDNKTFQSIFYGILKGLKGVDTTILLSHIVGKGYVMIGTTCAKTLLGLLGLPVPASRDPMTGSVRSTVGLHNLWQGYLLSVAVLHHCVPAAEMLAESADPTYRDKSGLTTLQHVMNTLVISNSDLSALVGEGNFMRTLTKLISRSEVDVRINDMHRNTLLTLIAKARHGGSDVMQILLSRNDIDINSKNGMGRTALHEIIRTAEDICKPIQYGMSFQLREALFPIIEKLELLLQCPELDVNGVDDAGYSPLFYVTRIGMADMVVLQQLLRRVDLNPHFQNSRGETALQLAQNISPEYGVLFEALISGH